MRSTGELFLPWIDVLSEEAGAEPLQIVAFILECVMNTAGERKDCSGPEDDEDGSSKFVAGLGFEHETTLGIDEPSF
jgi:hypothetical protein